jgi:glycosyltransferase involved in cell wall biosynthesis
MEQSLPKTAVCPLLPDVGVLALVPDPWDSVWQARHHVLTRLARYFHVVWMNPPRPWRDIVRGSAVPAIRNDATVYPGLSIHEPESWLPHLHRPSWLATLTQNARLARARNMLIRRGCRTIILYLWRPEFVTALGNSGFERAYYHIDDEYSFSSFEMPISAVERRLIKTVDQVFIGSPALIAKKGTINANTTFAPNGTDYAAYAADSPEPSDIASIPHPRIGYTGVVKCQLDWPMLKRLPFARPHWSFVFVGPIQEHSVTRRAVEDMSRYPNVHFLGFKTPQQLAAYPRHFDVCVMPYQTDEYTKYIYPLKLHEYLASGRPVVAARIRSVEEFQSVLTLVEDAESWPRAISDALSPSANSPERVAARRAVAREHDWNLLVSRMAQTMAARLAPDCLERLKRALETKKITARSPSAAVSDRSSIQSSGHGF